MKTHYETLIVGGGPNGLAVALALAYFGSCLCVVDAGDITQGRKDSRASALSASSVVMLKKLGVWNKIEARAQAVNDMLIGEGRVGSISPLSLHFEGASRESAMAFIVENEILRQALYQTAAESDLIDIRNHRHVIELSRVNGCARLVLDNEESLTAPLVVGADGRNSALRKLAQIERSQHDYEQKALTLTLSHSAPHHGVAHQLFLSGGPFALLPLVDNRVSVVWSDKADVIDSALSLPRAAFEGELKRRIGDILGDIKIESESTAYPLSLQMTEVMVKDRVAILGDAAHVIHPLAGQGLNLGFRDAAALAECVKEARSSGMDIGGASLVNYERWRQMDIAGLASATDTLNRLFSNSITPLRHMRRLGLAAVDSITPLRHFFIAEAAGETGDLPSLLRA